MINEQRFVLIFGLSILSLSALFPPTTNTNYPEKSQRVSILSSSPYRATREDRSTGGNILVTTIPVKIDSSLMFAEWVLIAAATGAVFTALGYKKSDD